MVLFIVAFIIIMTIALNFPGKRKKRGWNGDSGDWSDVWIDSDSGDSDGGDGGGD